MIEKPKLLLVWVQPKSYSAVFLADQRVGVVEVLVSRHAAVVGRSLREIHFRQKFGIAALAILRQMAVLAGFFLVSLLPAQVLSGVATTVLDCSNSIKRRNSTACERLPSGNDSGAWRLFRVSHTRQSSGERPGDGTRWISFQRFRLFRSSNSAFPAIQRSSASLK